MLCDKVCRGLWFGVKLKLLIRSIKLLPLMLSGCAQVLFKFLRWKRKFRTLWWHSLGQLLLILKTEEGPCYLSHHGGQAITCWEEEHREKGFTLAGIWEKLPRTVAQAWEERGHQAPHPHPGGRKSHARNRGGVTRPVWETPISSSSDWRRDGVWPWVDLFRVWSNMAVIRKGQQWTDNRHPPFWVTVQLLL